VERGYNLPIWSQLSKIQCELKDSGRDTFDHVKGMMHVFRVKR